MNDDHQQLEAYVTTGSEAAFASLVQRHAPLVYAVALRRVGGDAHRAQDVTQLVFTSVARQAAALCRHPDLVGWLFTTTRHVAAKTVRTESRRVARELAAASDPSLMDDPSSPLPTSALEPVLDDCLAELPAADRQVILLRFHQGRRLGEIANQIGASENAAQKRVERALERLRARLNGRGITSTAAALALMLEQQSAVALPAGLVRAVTSASLAQTAAGAATGSGVIALSKFQLTAAAAVFVSLTAATFWQVQTNIRLRRELASPPGRVDAKTTELRSKIATMSARTRSVANDVAKMQSALQATASVAPERVLVDPDAEAQSAMRHASTLSHNGKPDEAVAEYIRLYHTVKGSRSGIHRQIIIGSLAQLGRTHPPALAALRELRDQTMEVHRANPSDRNAVTDAALLNDRLGDSAANLALYDSLPEGHPGRQSIAVIAQKALVERRRYADALIGKSYPAMLREFELTTRLPASASLQSDSGQRVLAIQQTAMNIEVLAGAGLKAEAQALADKLLAFDSSESTRALVQQHLAHAAPAPSP